MKQVSTRGMATTFSNTRERSAHVGRKEKKSILCLLKISLMPRLLQNVLASFLTLRRPPIEKGTIKDNFKDLVEADPVPLLVRSRRILKMLLKFTNLKIL